MSERLIVFDTTLRDGEQSPGCSLDPGQKLRMANALAQLGVDVIEAGYPNASDGDFRSVREIARQIEGPVICGLARCHEADIRATAEALAPATRRRIHVFIASSPIHREHKLKLSAEQVVERAIAGVRQARSHCQDVEFSAEDATRSEPDFLARLFSAVIEAGATTVNVPDTVGYTTPGEILRAHPLPAPARARHRPASPSARIATTTSGWRSPTAWPRSRPARARSSAPSPASASAPATARWRKW